MLSKEEEYNLRKKIRNIIKENNKKVFYSPSQEDYFEIDKKYHNDIIIGPGMSGGQNLSMSPSNNLR
jgi:septin family protein